jgi:hypothetical protein
MSATAVKKPSTLSERSSPQDGDVVVTRHAQSRVHYTVRQLPGIVQFSTTVGEEAMRLAAGFAEKHAVNVWYTDGGGMYRRVEVGRPSTSSDAPIRQSDGVVSKS